MVEMTVVSRRVFISYAHREQGKPSGAVWPNDHPCLDHMHSRVPLTP
jgi:hypothetical protein